MTEKPISDSVLGSVPTPPHTTFADSHPEGATAEVPHWAVTDVRDYLRMQADLAPVLVSLPDADRAAHAQAYRSIQAQFNQQDPNTDPRESMWNVAGGLSAASGEAGQENLSLAASLAFELYDMMGRGDNTAAMKANLAEYRADPEGYRQRIHEIESRMAEVLQRASADAQHPAAGETAGPVVDKAERALVEAGNVLQALKSKYPGLGFVDFIFPSAVTQKEADALNEPFSGSMRAVEERARQIRETALLPEEAARLREVIEPLVAVTRETTLDDTTRAIAGLLHLRGSSVDRYTNLLVSDPFTLGALLDRLGFSAKAAAYYSELLTLSVSQAPAGESGWLRMSFQRNRETGLIDESPMAAIPEWVTPEQRATLAEKYGRR